jgi:hypothetical protein
VGAGATTLFGKPRSSGFGTNIAVFGKLPELVIELSEGHRVLSFMTSDGDPQWALFDRRLSKPKWLCAREGRLVEETAGD